MLIFERLALVWEVHRAMSVVFELQLSDPWGHFGSCRIDFGVSWMLKFVQNASGMPSCPHLQGLSGGEGGTEGTQGPPHPPGLPSQTPLPPLPPFILTRLDRGFQCTGTVIWAALGPLRAL